ncbi:hypothetical protein TYRP_003049 [Tyrophagus putrescentiae]|nr:hypothetical protein TYRP_003049 [Tyrophagus putrescentiae]
MIPKAFSLLTLVVVFYAVLKVAYGSVITGASNVDKNDEEESHRVPVLDPLTDSRQHLLHSRRSVPNQGSSSSSSSSKDQAGLYQDEDIHNSQSFNVARSPVVVSPYPRSSSSVVVVDSNGRAYEVSPKSQLDGSQPGHPSASFWPDGSTVYLDWGQHVDCSFRCYEADQSRYLYDCMMGCTAHLASGGGGGGNAGPDYYGNGIGFGSGPTKFPNMF